MAVALLGIRDVIQKVGFYLNFKFIGKKRKLKIFFSRIVQFDIIKHFAAFGVFFFMFVKRKMVRRT